MNKNECKILIYHFLKWNIFPYFGYYFNECKKYLLFNASYLSLIFKILVMVQNELRLIDLTVEQLRSLLKENVTITSPSLKDADEIGGIDLAKRVTKLSFKTIYQLTSKRKIPFFKKGKFLYFSKTELENWIRSGKKQTITDIQEAASQYLLKKR